MKHLTQLKTWLAMCLLFFCVKASAEITYTKVTDVSELSAGDVIVLVCEYDGTKKELSGFDTGSNNQPYGTAQDYSTTPTGIYELTLEKDNTTGTFAMKNGSEYISWTSDNSLTTSSKINNNSSWKITISEGNTSISNVNTPERKLQYYSKTPRFACYETTQKSIQIYKKGDVVKPFESEFALTEFFSETFGEGANNVNVTNYSGWTGTGTIYSGSAKVGNTNSNVCDLPNSSGEGYFYMSSDNINEFVISGLNTSNLSNVKMTFNYRGANADAKFKIECSTDGGANYEKLANSTDMSTKWQTSSEYEIPASDNLCIKFILLEITIGNYRTVYFDDLKIKASSTTLKTATPEGYATFYSDKAIILPEGITAATASTDANGSLVWNWVYNEGDNVPAGTPILVKGNEGAKSYTAFESNTLASAPAINYLKANNTAFNKQASTLANSTDKFYVLSYNASHENLGFYWYTANGDGNFSVPAGKVVLALPSNGGNAKAGFALDGDEVAIQEAKAEDTNKITYNLYGQRTKANHNGLYIVNGKKIIIK